MSITGATTLSGLNPPVWPITIDKYLSMVNAGVLDRRDRVYLWKGRLAPKVTTIGRAHVLAVLRLSELLRRSVPKGYYVEPEAPLAFLTESSVPEPDLKIVRGRPEDYPRDYPTTKDVPLVIEVSDKTLRDDRAMASDYAAEGIPFYWIVNLAERSVEVHAHPAAGVYRQRNTFSLGEEVPLRIDEREVGVIAVSEILPS